MKILLRSFLILFCLVFQVHAYQLTAETDTAQVARGEPLTLIITADDMVTDSPDLTSLQTDFQVLSTSVSRRTTYNNGIKSAQTSWQIGLLPLKSGKLQIPSVSVGNQATPVLPVEVFTASAVNPQPAGAVQQNDEYTIEGKTVGTAGQIYVQQQIGYNVIVSDNGTLQSGEPVFQTSDSSEWIIKSLGRPEISAATGGRRMITYRYALFPQKSGRLHIPAVVFDGQAAGDGLNPNFDPFGNGMFNISINLSSVFNMNMPVRLSLPAEEIEVLPVPEAFRGNWWLPAEDVKISARWLNPAQKFQAGEAATREIVLTATGVTETQLPEIKILPATDLKQYPQKSEKYEALSDGRLTASQKMNIVYIPQKGGMLTLPEIRVPWFNVATGKMEEAVVPASIIEVGSGAVEAVPLPQKTQKINIAAQPEPAAKMQTEVQNISAFRKIPTWLWAVAAFLLGILCAAFLLRPKRLNQAKPACETRQFPDYIVQKAYQNDYRALRDALVTWAAGYYPQATINNLKDVAAAAGDEAFSRQIDILLEKLYQADSGQVWNAKVFADSFKRLLQKKHKKEQKNPKLPPLYD